MSMKPKLVVTLLLMAAVMSPAVHAAAQASVSPTEARAIAREAYVYANPLVDSYRVLYFTC